MLTSPFALDRLPEFQAAARRTRVGPCIEHSGVEVTWHRGNSDTPAEERRTLACGLRALLCVTAVPRREAKESAAPCAVPPDRLLVVDGHVPIGGRTAQTELGIAGVRLASDASKFIGPAGLGVPQRLHQPSLSGGNLRFRLRRLAFGLRFLGGQNRLRHPAGEKICHAQERTICIGRCIWVFMLSVHGFCS